MLLITLTQVELSQQLQLASYLISYRQAILTFGFVFAPLASTFAMLYVPTLVTIINMVKIDYIETVRDNWLRFNCRSCCAPLVAKHLLISSNFQFAIRKIIWESKWLQ